METREMQYFVAVAEELHFGRAAERLGISQPPLSRAIRQLEIRLGTDLLRRTSRHVELTEAGSVLLRESRAALAAVAAAERRTRRVAAQEPVVLVVKAAATGRLVTDLLERHSVQPGAGPVRLEPCGIGEQVRSVRDGRADIAILHLPYDDLTGLDHVELGRESQVMLVAAGHPAASRTSITLAEVDELLLDAPAPRWVDSDGRLPEGPGPVARDHGQLQALVALGQATWLAPESCRELLRPDIAAIPVSDAEPITTVLAWPAHGTSDAVAHLVATATGADTSTSNADGLLPLER
ncbi:MAG: LysR family transcriptional regulator [Patulibacter minatonensis]